MKEEDKNVIPLVDPGPSVEKILSEVNKFAEGMRSIAVVAVLKSGQMTGWISGRCEDICASALYLDEQAKDFIMGEPVEDNPGPKK